MIQTHELRLNNAVLCNNKIAYITSIEEDNINAEDDSGQKYAELAKSDIFPIPLSPEILQANGNLEGRCFYFKEQGAVKFIMWQDQVDNSYHYNNGNNNIIVESLHQLQNLFFALTGTELTINLEKVKV